MTAPTPEDTLPNARREVDATDAAETSGGGTSVPGGRIGRFVVLEAIGRGGMGIVLAAYDPDLDRKVAIKLLAQVGDHGGRGTDRLVREARAMARLVHPNVLVVHEVGAVDAHAFIAMEFAPGGTLGAWCASGSRSWRAILDRLMQAGRGLAAAHAAGLVHRDFKPDNVLLTADGTARVADFGLVSGAAADRDEPVGAHDASDVAPTLTEPGARLGTPAYMAPEQFLGEEVGPAADQFAFCVAAWTLLFAERPFTGRTSAELSAAVLRGELVEPPSDRGVPGWVRAVLARGLARGPAARWPSMTALLAALANDPIAARRRRLRHAGLGVGVLASIALAVFGATRGADPPATLCRGSEERLAGIWDPTRAAELRGSLVATGRSYAADTVARVTSRLDAYAGAWVHARVDACQATHVRGEQSDALLDLRMGCLDRHLVALDELVDAMATSANVAVLDRAVDAVAALPAVDACADAAALQAAIPLPAAAGTRAAINGLRQLLARSNALDDIGRFPEGLAVVQPAATAALAIQYPPVVAEALALRASLEERTGDPGAAEVTLEQALLAAAAAHDDRLVARITSDLVFIVGYRLARKEDAGSLRRRLDAALARVSDDRALAARGANSLGLMYTALADRAEARRQLERAITLWEAERGPDDRETATSINNLGNVFQDAGDYAAARSYVERGLAIRERTLGPDHPDVAMSVDNLANAHNSLGNYAESVRLHERALAIYTRALGPDNLDVAITRNNLADALFNAGAYAEARRHIELCIASWEKALGPDDPGLMYPLDNLAKLLTVEGDFAGARRHLARALAIVEKKHGAGSVRGAGSLHLMGRVEFADGKAAAALALYRRVVAMFEQAGSPRHAALGNVLTDLADAALAVGRTGEAVIAAERALDLATTTQAPVADLAAARFALARSLWPDRRARARARDLAVAAREGYAAAGAPVAARLAEVDAWLADHRHR